MNDCNEERFIEFLNSKGFKLPEGHRAIVTPIGSSRKYHVELVKDG
jgi:hypothetical protein